MPGDGLYDVNWKTSMLLGDQHLRLADECATQARRWVARAVAPAVGGYGLLPPARGGGVGLRLRHEHGADRLTVHVQTLFAVAPDGTALAYDEDEFPELSGQLSAHADLERNPAEPVALAVLVDVVADDDEGAGRIEIGDPDPREDPPRKPLAARRLRARIQADGQSARGMLKVAEYRWDGVDVEPASDYLPPMLTLAAWPDGSRQAHDVRKQIDRLRDVLVHGSNQAESLVADVTLPWLAALSALTDGVPASASTFHPYAVWETATRALRVSRTMLAARAAAVEHSLKMFVQPGKLSTGNASFYEDLDAFLDRPYDHDDVGRSMRQSLEMVAGMREICEFLLGAAPVREEAKDETDVYYYKDKKYRLAEYHARTVDAGEAWHFCHLRELSIENPKSLLLVCDSSLLAQQIRPNARIQMLDRHETFAANMWPAYIDNESDASKIVALFTDINEPTVTDISLAATRDLLDLSGLGPEPDEQIRIYYEN